MRGAIRRAVGGVKDKRDGVRIVTNGRSATTTVSITTVVERNVGITQATMRRHTQRCKGMR